MKRLGVIAFAVLVIACGGRDTPDDQALHQDIQNTSSGAEVTFHATLVTDPVEVDSHERFFVRVPTGETLEIDHNTSLAESVPVHKGDAVIIHGQLYVDPGRQGIHCTHSQTSSGCPYPGWIEYNNHYYE